MATTGFLGQVNESQRLIREHFERGGSATGVLLVAGLLVVIVLLAYWLTKRQLNRARTKGPADPEALFASVLNRLELTPVHHRRLAMLARDLQLEHPVTMLLSPRVLDRCVARWRERHVQREPDLRAIQEFTEEVRTRLFPSHEHETTDET